MSDRSLTLEPRNSEDLCSAISSPVSEAGPLLQEWPVGQTLDLFGQDLARASHSVSPESKKARRTKGTCGPPSSTSLEPTGPKSSWENRLRQRLEKIGSTECILTWKASATPAGRQLFRLTVSVRPTSATDFTLLPTPAAQTQQGGLRIEGGARARQKWRALGIMPNGKGDQVGISAWLMGFPPSWLKALPADLVTPSSRRSLRKS